MLKGSIDTGHLRHLWLMPFRRNPSGNQPLADDGACCKLYIACYLLLHIHVLYAISGKMANITRHSSCIIIFSSNMPVAGPYNCKATLDYECMYVVLYAREPHDYAVYNQAEKHRAIPGIICRTRKNVMWYYVRYLPWCDGMPLRYDCHTSHTQK